MIDFSLKKLNEACAKNPDMPYILTMARFPWTLNAEKRENLKQKGATMFDAERIRVPEIPKEEIMAFVAGVKENG